MKTSHNKLSISIGLIMGGALLHSTSAMAAVASSPAYVDPDNPAISALPVTIDGAGVTFQSPGLRSYYDNTLPTWNPSGSPYVNDGDTSQSLTPSSRDANSPVAGHPHQAWTHNSKWAVFQGTAGQKIQINMSRSIPSSIAHPAFTLFYGTHNDFGNCNGSQYCVPGHHFSQDKDWSGSADTDWVIGSDPNDYTLTNVATGWDNDVSSTQTFGLSDYVGNGDTYLEPYADTDTDPGSLTSGVITLPATGQYLLAISNATTDNVNGTILVDAQVVSAVPLPAAAWLFAPAIAGLFGFGRRKAVQE